MEKIEALPGVVVRSLKGHDTGGCYVVTERVNPEFVLIADGKNRTVDKPKLKRIKHLKVLSAGPDGAEPPKLTDSAIVNILRKLEGG